MPSDAKRATRMELQPSSQLKRGSRRQHVEAVLERMFAKRQMSAKQRFAPYQGWEDQSGESR